MRIGWLTTGRDPAARELLSEVARRSARDGLDLEIAALFCDRERGESAQSDLLLDLADVLHIPAITLSSAASWRQWWRAPVAAEMGDVVHKTVDRERWRAAFHEQVGQRLEPLGLDLLVLAGYMLVVSPAMCERFAMLNLHPALPAGPIGMWQEVIWELLRTESHETGALINQVTSELDRGPVVTYCSFPIVGRAYDALWHGLRTKTARRGLTEVMAAEGESEPLFAEVRRQGERREIPLLYLTLRQFAEGRLGSRDGRVDGVGVELPLSLTGEVEAELRRNAAEAGR